MFVYLGTYTHGKSKGIYVLSMDPGSGKLELLSTAGGVQSPSFLAIHPAKRFLYAVEEVDDGQVAAFALDPASGALTFLNRQPSGGVWPCHLSLNKAGRHALAANYGSGTFSALPIRADGTLSPATCTVKNEGAGPNKQRQEGPHGHSIHLSPDGRFALACDLGLDKVFLYRFDEARGLLAPNDPPFARLAPGDGPRHLAFHPSGRFVFVNGEMTSTVTSFAYDASRGALTRIGAVSTLPEGFVGENSTAEVVVHPNGRFVYVSNRGHDSLALLAVDPSAGTLRPIGHQSTRGKTPRNFAIAPGGKFLLAANQGSDSVVVFRIDGRTGRLTPTGQALEIPSPVCVRYLAP